MEGQVQREPNYSGGMSIDHENTNTLYLSIKRDSVFEIEKWETGNGGKSWKASRFTSGSSKNNVRPVAVRGATEGNPLQVLWMCNTRYTHYTDYQAAIQMGLVPGPVSGGLDSKSILDVMHRVADWQIMNPREPHQLDWHYGAFYTGVWTLYKTTGEERYKNEIWNLGQKYNWKLLNDIYHADRLTIAQSFVDLYMEEKDPDMLEKIQWVLDMHVDRRPHADVRYKDNPYSGEWWTWCDALYMAPPTFARVFKATGENKYLEYMDKHWWKTSDYLYSKEDSLYYRDDRFFDQRTENGKKLFWGRGNGWVIAGLARTIPYIPEDFPDRWKFIQQFKEMAAKLLRIQDEDGLWRVSLDDPAYLDMGESSGSAFFTFALAWGVNNDLLDAERYSPAILKAWKALVGNVNEQGRLGFVQQVAGSPYPFFDYQSHVYASGAFLLAGCEILKLIK
jgi:rhamnogalacturonyl hydrolase YesR